jgi:hypothetical protein
MCAINRSAVLVLPAQPSLEWLHQADEFSAGTCGRAVIACVAGSVVRLTNPVPPMETTQWITRRKKSSQ